MSQIVTLTEVKSYCDSRLGEIRSVIRVSPAFGFVCMAAFVEFLSKLYSGKDGKADGYIDFIRETFPPKYISCRFNSGDYDLPDQIYKTFRCGMLHAFSLTPDEPNRGSNKVRTIVISHDGKYGEKQYKHLDKFQENGFDAVVLIADDFCNDIQLAMNKFLTDSSYYNKVTGRIKQQPPLSSIYEKYAKTRDVKI